MIKNIIFDFDGVILDSVPVKTEAYRQLFNNYDKKLIDLMVQYHELNGGVSRYLKIKYFFNELLNQDISEEEIINYANKYSDLTKLELTKHKYIINDSLNFIKNNYKNYNLHIASGADHSDLLFICGKLNLSKFFLSINGSPVIKTKIVKEIIETYNYNESETILIGDSINDYESANSNGINFYGYNNLALKKFNYIETFGSFL